MAKRIERAGPGEYVEFYETYVGRVAPDADVLALLRAEIATTCALFAGVPEDRESWTYGPGKWSFREVAGHLADSERVFAYRAVHIARGDAESLPGMDQHVWADGSNAHDRPLGEILDEWRASRESTVRLFAGLADEALDRRGVASGAEVSVRALASIILGHELHHRGVLRERYLKGAGDG